MPNKTGKYHIVNLKPETYERLMKNRLIPTESPDSVLTRVLDRLGGKK